MKKTILPLIIIGSFFIPIAFIVYLFLSQFWIAGQIDGNKPNANTSNNHYLLLTESFYFDTKNRIIIKKINKELEEIIVKDNIDSLCWNDSLIIGYSNEKYFIIEPRIDYLKIKYVNYIKKDNYLYNKYYKIYSLKGIRIKDTIFD